MVVEKANGDVTSGADDTSYMEWHLYTWDPAHRMELVTDDIQEDRADVDTESMPVPWYSPTTKEISAMYATCS